MSYTIYKIEGENIMDREAKIVKLKLDVIFKRVFGNEQMRR